MKKHCDRRAFVKEGLKFASAFTFIGMLVACGGSGAEGKKTTPEKAPESNAPQADGATDPCDVNALTEKDVSNRKALGYVDQTPIAERTCENCKLYVPANDSKTCGTCPLFKGPVTLEGYCTYWADAAT